MVLIKEYIKIKFEFFVHILRQFILSDEMFELMVKVLFAKKENIF